ncbi:MAG: SPOR domain-containing protein [Gammaproteobacteria bacterium]|nr:SPOR domain-containing protein [Gammaproteobacteria bacterium]
MKATWQQLLSQAFRQTDPGDFPHNMLGLWHLHRYVYRVLQNAGIENRSPFSLLQLYSIHKLAQGNPQHVRQLCIDTVASMSKPIGRFHATVYLPFALLLVLLAFIMLPKTATTFPSSVKQHSVMQDVSPRQPTMPERDHDSLELVLPSASDYLTAASLYLEPEPEPAAVAAVISEKGPFGTAWIKQQPDRSYSLQMFSASNIDNLQKFCQQHQICDQSAWYPSEVNGKKLYRLLYGVYRNHQAAKIAKAQLPESLQNASPWARQFKQIKTEL